MEITNFNCSGVNVKDLLNLLVESDTIASEEELLRKIESMRDKEYLKRHMKAITHGADGRYSTYIYDGKAPSSRRKIVKKTREAMEKELIRFYKERDEERIKKGYTLRQLYPEWLEFKSVHTESTKYVKTIDELWRRFYLDSPIIDIPICRLDKKTLELWAYKLVRDNEMTKKKYYNTTIIMRQCLAYAVDCGIIDDNPFERVTMDKKMFRKQKKKPDETQVFLEDEQARIIEEAFAHFEKTRDVACLAIPFDFYTGVRVSELVSLKWSDIDEEIAGTIHVQRMETVAYTVQSEGKWTSPQRVIIERTKSDEGNRNVYLPTKAREILKMIRAEHEAHGYDSEFIFVNTKGRIHESALTYRIHRYCDRIGIPRKSMHKIRKTYISTLIDSGNVNINAIRQLVGHADERTTYLNYCFNRRSKDDTVEELEKALIKPKK